MPVTLIKAAARSCPYFTLLIALGLGPCSAGALASSNITKRIHYFDVGFSGSAIRLYTTGECYAYPIENDLLINKPFSWEKLQIPETGANSVKALI